MSRRLLITGSQLWTDTRVIRDALAQVWHPDTTLMSGACPRGADRLCEECWTHWGGRVDRYPAAWIVDGHYRRDAGFRRNELMVATAVELGAARCLAFVRDGSPGSTHTVGLAQRAGLWTTVYRATSASAAEQVWTHVWAGL